MLIKLEPDSEKPTSPKLPPSIYPSHTTIYRFWPSYNRSIQRAQERKDLTTRTHWPPEVATAAETTKKGGTEEPYKCFIFLTWYN